MSILTVSRQLGSGSTEVLNEVRASLPYRLINKRALFNDIRASGEKWEAWARELDESAPTFWERHDRSFRGAGALLQSILLKYALQDNVILKGRGANFLLAGIPHALRVRFVASLEHRLEHITMRDALDDETARSLIEQTDRGRAGFVKALYGEDVDDPRNYDMVFDTGAHSAKDIGEIIVKALLERVELKTPAAQKLLSLRAAAANIRAKMITDPQLYVPVLDVECSQSELILKGIVRNPDQFRRIVEVSRQLAGEWPVKVELRYRI